MEQHIAYSPTYHIKLFVLCMKILRQPYDNI